MLFVAEMLIGNFSLKREENPIKVIAMFASDIQLTVGLNNSIADITVQLDQDYRGKTRGLLGESIISVRVFNLLYVTTQTCDFSGFFLISGSPFAAKFS